MKKTEALKKLRIIEQDVEHMIDFLELEDSQSPWDPRDVDNWYSFRDILVQLKSYIVNTNKGAIKCSKPTSTNPKKPQPATGLGTSI